MAFSVWLWCGADGQRNTNAAKLALVTGVFIASYSFVDGLGARFAGTSLGFYGWLSLGDGILMASYLAVVSPKALGKIARKGRSIFLIGGNITVFTRLDYNLIILNPFKSPYH